MIVYALLRYIVRTPFGLTLQGVRDDPVRMTSLGYNVVLHRTSGSRSRASSPRSRACCSSGGTGTWTRRRSTRRDDRRARDRRVGGLYRLEGAWLGAFVFIVLDNYSRQIDFVGPRFHTLIGLV